MWNTLYSIFTTILATVLILTTVILLYYKHAFNHWKNLDIPYPEPSFPFGNIKSNFEHNLGQNIVKIYKDMKNCSAEYCGFFMFSIPIFMPISPEMIKDIITKKFQYFHDRGIYCDEENEPTSVSLVNLSGQEWKFTRNKLSPTFTSGKNRMMFPVIRACSNELENILDEVSRKSETINMLDIANRYTTDVIFSSVFGLECNSLKNPNSECRKYGQMIFSNSFSANMRLGLGFIAPSLLSALKIHWMNPKVSTYFRKIIKETVEYREDNNIKRNDFVNLLIRLKNNEDIQDDQFLLEKSSDGFDDKPGLTIDQITAHCFIFFLAGYETTSQTISFCTYELALNQDIQAKLRRDINYNLEQHNGEITYDAIMAMEYLDKVVNETLRKFPGVHMINRICTQDYCIPKTNTVIKKGTKVIISTLALHMDPEYYPNPQKFDPERFTKQEIAKRPTHTYMPFGDGPRICPGIKFGILQAKTCIIKMLKNYKFTLHPKVNKCVAISSKGNMIHPTEEILLFAEKL